MKPGREVSSSTVERLERNTEVQDKLSDLEHGDVLFPPHFHSTSRLVVVPANVSLGWIQGIQGLTNT